MNRFVEQPGCSPFARRRGTRRARLGLAVACLVLASSTALAGVKPPKVKLDVETYTLPNGLTVILSENHRLPIVGVNLWYHVGPVNEAKGRTGFAHLFEHMMFQGSGHVPEDKYFAILEGAGASLVNGSTDFDRTNYLEDVPSDQLELALWLESDRMGFLLDRVDEWSLANQRDVVRNERRQSTENAPYGLVDEEMYHLLFPSDHPYYANVIGSHEDIQAGSLEDVRAFFKQYYTPNNASLAVVGDIDKARTKALVEKYFGTIKRGEPVPPVTAKTPPITEERRAVVSDNVELPKVFMSWITPPIYKPGDAEFDLIATILAGGKASRLYKSLVYEKQIAQDVSAQQYSLTLGSVFTISATAKPGHTADELETGINEELARFAKDGPTDAELEAAQNTLYARIVMSLERVGWFGGIADRLNQYNHHVGNPDYVNQDLARYGDATRASLRKYASEQLKMNARVVVHGVPGEKKVPPAPETPPMPEKVASTTVSAEPWRNEMPKPGPTPQVNLPAPKRFTLPNGLPVYFVEDHGLPLVGATLAVRAGSAMDPKSLEGLAGFACSMLDEGTAKRDALGLANEVFALGASFGVDASQDASSGGIRSLAHNTEKSLSILSDVMLNPSFPPSEIERIRNERITAILQQRDSPWATASRVMARCLYGPTHPYGHPSLGLEEGLTKASRDDMMEFYKTTFYPSNAALFLLGDLTEADAKKLASKAFGAWQGEGRQAPRPAAGSAIDQRVVIVDKKGAPQTVVLVGQMGVTRNDPDYEKLYVMNEVLGGLFSSRINMNLREDKGYSYGAFSYVGENRGVGPLAAGAMVRADVTGQSIEEILKEVSKMKQDGVTAEELKLAKDGMIRSLPARFETMSKTIRTLSSIWMHDLPADYYETMPTRIDAIGEADVLATARKYLQPETMLVVAVGDRSVIEPQISKLDLGAVAYRDADGMEPKGGQDDLGANRRR